MAGKDIITMSQKELKRLHVIHKVLDKRLKQTHAAKILGLVDRQIRRIARRVREEGDKGIIHKSRGKISNRSLSKLLKEKTIKLYRKRYKDFGPKFANEKLFEINKIKLGNQTLRNWLIEDGSWRIIRKHRKHCQWRERKHHFGEMIQLDGSHHDWFEGRGPKCVLMGYIDDATNTSFARFYSHEGTFPAMDSFKRYMRKYGIPISVYLDKHTTYKSTKKLSIEDELNQVQPLSQFERALKELGVEVIHANSPQAKGRIERLFKTFQDRLVKEMRLKNVKTMKKANELLGWYLKEHNKRFAFKPLEKVDFHRTILKTIDLDKILCVKTCRTLRNDFTIVHNKELYQITDKVNAKIVILEERINGRMLITSKGRSLKYKPITRKIPAETKSKSTYIFKIHTKPPTPSKDHPWRKPACKGGYKHSNSCSHKEKELLLKPDTSTCAKTGHF